MVKVNYKWIQLPTCTKTKKFTDHHSALIARYKYMEFITK